ncbi:MAG: hypothetical protein MUE85_07840 [Microscillaceae bacterium]|jgi:hypothetical protein|nr:hypothetical protein [Microscillaceae bacterium]
MKSLIERNLSGKNVIISLVLANIVYGIMLGITIPAVLQYSGGKQIFDLLPTGYSPAYAHQLLNALGEKGRTAYLYQQIPFDLMYPLLFGISYCLLLAYILRKTNRWESGFYWVCIFPLIGGLSDYFENFCVIGLLTQYPNFSDNLVLMASFFSISKSLFTSLYFLGLIYALGLWLGQAWRKS